MMFVRTIWGIGFGPVLWNLRSRRRSSEAFRTEAFSEHITTVCQKLPDTLHNPLRDFYLSCNLRREAQTRSPKPHLAAASGVWRRTCNAPGCDENAGSAL